MNKETRILLIEDSENDAMLLEWELKRGGLTTLVQRVDTLGALKREIAKGSYDLVISDYVLPSFTGMHAMQLVRACDENLPFILMSGKIGEETAVEAIRSGANDYIMKDNMARLPTAVKRALEEAAVKKERSKAKEDLTSSLEELKHRSAQLEESNQLLQTEVEIRKKAQLAAAEASDYRLNIIDSASELVFSIDNNHRVTTWNRSIRMLTGIDDREVINRGLEHLAAFPAARVMMDDVADAIPEGRTTLEFPLVTKEGSKKIVRAIASVIKGPKDSSQGILFVGKDITPDLKEHGKLIEGFSYLVKEREMGPAMTLFANLCRLGHEGLLITRANPDLLGSWIEPSDPIGVVPLNARAHGPQDPLHMVFTQVEAFCTRDSRRVILLDGTHYLIAQASFERFLQTLFNINDLVARSRPILLVRVDPVTLDTRELALLENELLPLPSQRISDVRIADEEYELLRYINEQNRSNAIVTLKKAVAKLDVSHVTVAKRIEALESSGLIYVKKQGRYRTPFLTEKGRALLESRKTA
jgi:PAS domain S-box-containing protein